MHQGNRLEYLLKRSGKSLIHISEKAGIARQSLYNYLGMEEIPRKKLLKILEAAEIEGTEFFISEISDPAAEYRVLKEKVKSLEQMIHDKEVIIIQQKEMIELLKQQRIHKPKK